jgi:phage shock protein A
MPDSSPGGPPAPEPTPEAPVEIIDAEIVEDPAELLASATADPPAFTPDYDERGVPSFDYVRAKIEGRSATAVGSTELAGESAQGRALDDEMAERDRKAKEKLDEIRRSLGG